MSYRLEVAFNLRHTSGALELKRDLIEIAKSYGCELSYSDFEFEGKNRTVTRNHIFIIFFFPEDPKHVINFLTFLKKQRKNGLGVPPFKASEILRNTLGPTHQPHP